MKIMSNSFVVSKLFPIFAIMILEKLWLCCDK